MRAWTPGCINIPVGFLFRLDMDGMVVYVVQVMHPVYAVYVAYGRNAQFGRLYRAPGSKIPPIIML